MWYNLGPGSHLVPDDLHDLNVLAKCDNLSETHGCLRLAFVNEIKCKPERWFFIVYLLID